MLIMTKPIHYFIKLAYGIKQLLNIVLSLKRLMSLKSSTVEAGNATHLLERLSSMHKALGSVPITTSSLGVMVHTYNPDTQEAEARG